MSVNFKKLVERAILEKGKTEIVSELIDLSSGTLASIFNVNRYEEIDATRERLIAWAEENYDEAWVNWQDVVKAFKSGEALADAEQKALAAGLQQPGEEDEPDT